MKKIAMFFILLLCLTNCAKKEESVVLPLREEEIEEAFEYGRKNADLTFIEFTKDWTVDLGYEQGKGTATLITPFVRVALLGKRAAQLGQKIDYKLVKIVLKDEIGILYFHVSLYGDTPTFSRKTKFSLKYKGQSFEPVSVFVPTYTEFTRDYYNIAKGKIKFKKQDIPSDSTVTLVVTFPQEEMSKEYFCEFEFNLSKYK